MGGKSVQKICPLSLLLSVTYAYDVTCSTCLFSLVTNIFLFCQLSADGIKMSSWEINPGCLRSNLLLTFSADL